MILQISLLYLISPTLSLRDALAAPSHSLPWIQCIQNAQKKYELKQGIASYWVSRPLILYAHLPIEQVFSNLHPQYWLTDTDSLQASTADFAVTDGHFLRTQPLIKIYGQPSQIIQCPFAGILPHINILIYPRGIPISRTAEFTLTPD